MSRQLQLFATLPPSSLPSFAQILTNTTHSLGGSWHISIVHYEGARILTTSLSDILRKGGVEIGADRAAARNTVTILPSKEFEEMKKAFSVVAHADLIVIDKSTGKVIQTAGVALRQKDDVVDIAANEVKAAIATALGSMKTAGRGRAIDVLRVKQDLAAGVERIRREIEGLGLEAEAAPLDAGELRAMLEQQEKMWGRMGVCGEVGNVDVGEKLEEIEAELRRIRGRIRGRIDALRVEKARKMLKLKQVCDQEGHSYFSIFNRTAVPLTAVFCSGSDSSLQLPVSVLEEMTLVEAATTLAVPGTKVWISRENERISNEIIVAESDCR